LATHSFGDGCNSYKNVHDKAWKNGKDFIW